VVLASWEKAAMAAWLQHGAAAQGSGVFRECRVLS
jgi:hypothetical protein